MDINFSKCTIQLVFIKTKSILKQNLPFLSYLSNRKTKKMKKSIVLFLIVTASLIALNAYSQNGKINLYVQMYTSYFDSEPAYNAYLVLNNERIQEQSFDEYDNDIYFKDLSPGFYNIEIERNDTLINTIHAVEVKENNLTKIDVTIDGRTFCDECEDTTRTEFFEILTGLSYGSDFLDDDNIFATQQYRTSLQLHQNFLISKNFSVGIGAGYNYSQTYFNTDSSFAQVPGIKNERYSYFDISYIFFLRFNPYNMKKDPARGLFIDAGVHYNFPMAFRHAYSVDNIRYMTARIHKYNDFSVIGRIGFYPVSLHAEYRLSDYVRHGFPQQPKLKAGITYHIFVE